MKPIPPTLRTLFADLVQQVETAPAIGTVYERENQGSAYLYAKTPVGTTRVDVFLGRKDDPAARARAEEHRHGMALSRDRRTLVALLRRGGLAAPDRSLGAAMDTIAYAGLFKNGAVLVGTAAYLLFEPHVGAQLPTPTLMTGDLDLATARVALTADPPDSMIAILKRADPTYDGVMQLDPRRPPSRFRNAEGYLVDLITPIRTREDSNPVDLPALEAGAAPLQYLAWLIQDAIPTVALWGAGIPVVIPQPARFAVHKLILAQRRDAANRLKRSKDLAQARALIEALTTYDPFALKDALEDARAKGQEGWAEPIARSLQELNWSEAD
jgi:hypothetical protein